jgi:hypothetical protein
VFARRQLSMRTLHRVLKSTAALVCLSSCDYSRDTVGPGYYGELSPAAGSGGSNRAVAGRGSMASVSTPPSATTPSWVSSGAGASKPPQSAGEASTPPSPANGGGAPCDLTGDWLMTLHKTTDGLGNLQTINNIFYYQIDQQAGAFVVSKSLLCGTSAVGGGAFAVMVDYQAAAAGVMGRVSHNGRKGTSRHDGDACQLQFEKQYTVAGATLPYYLDPSTTLPTADQMATDGNPGWEDWDGDGNPGITGVCSGTVNGRLYTAARDWVTLAGTVPSVESTFTLSMEWDQEQNVMAIEGSPFLGTEAVRAADPSLHFAQFARLSAEQAAGDAAALCMRLVELAPQLTPEAVGM